MLKKLTQRLLWQLPEKNIISNGLFRVSDLLFSFKNVSSTDQYKNQFSSLLRQSKLNAEIIPFSPQSIWPYWVYETTQPTSSAFTNYGSLPLMSNSSHRSWTSVGFPFSKTKCIVDPKGLLSLSKRQWSIDLWMSHGDTLTSLSKLTPIQTFDQRTGVVTTSATHNGIYLSSDVLLYQLKDPFELAVNRVTLTNTSDTPISFSFYFALRPYTREGVSPISSIVYHSSQAFIIDNKLGVIFDKTPDNIVCLNNKDGDVSQHVNDWEMILKTTCPDHQASAFAQFNLTLKPQEVANFTATLPSSFAEGIIQGPFTTLRKKNSDHLSALIANIKSIPSSALLQNPAYAAELSLIPELTLSNKSIEKIFNMSTYHLLTALNNQYTVSENQDRPMRELFEVYRALCNIGKVSIVKQALLAMSNKPLRSLITRSQRPIFVYSSIIRLTAMCYKRDKDIPFLKQLSHYLEKMYFSIKKYIMVKPNENNITGLLKPSSYSQKSGDKESLLISHYYALQAFSDLRDLCKDDPKPALIEDIEFTAANLTTSLNSYLKQIHDKKTKRPFIPVSLESMADHRLIENLNTVFMGICKADDPKIEAIVSWIEKQFCFNDIFYNAFFPNGYPVYGNLLLANYYIATFNSKAFKIIDFISSSALSTAALPESIHPKTLLGSQGNGHSPLSTAMYISTILSTVITIEKDTIHITPHCPMEWFEEEPHVVGISHLSTPFGEYSFTLRREGSTFTLKQTNTFKKRPSRIVITLPATITTIHYKSKSRPLQAETCRLEYYDAETTFETNYATEVLSNDDAT